VEELWARSGERLPLETVLAIGYEICDVLAAAHAGGIIHRDIKPANVFLTSAGVLKVLDFGIARLRDKASSSTATTTGAVVGTPAFMAPEQAGGREIDAATDIYATGATMFGLASGSLVHEGASIQAIVIRTATVPARSLADALPDAPRAVVGLIDRALAFERKDRWASAAEMRDAIRAASVAVFGRPPKLTVRGGGPVPGAPPSSKRSNNVAPTILSEARRPLGLWGPETLPDEPSIAMPGQGAALALKLVAGTVPRARPPARPPPSPPRPRRSRPSIVAVVIVAAGLAVLAAAILIADRRDAPAPSNAPAPPVSAAR
jgi:serine/threonine-protein kinase